MPTTPIYGFTEPTVGGSSGTWGTTLNALANSLEGTIGLPRIVAAAATVGVTTTLDLSVANVWSMLSLGQNTTIAFSNIPGYSTQVSSRVTVLLSLSAAYTITWPAAVVWVNPNNTAPAFVSGRSYVVELVTANNGGTWYGFVNPGGAGDPVLVPKRHTLATSSVDFQTSVGDGSYLLSWDTNDASDVGSLHSTSVNPSRIVIPSAWEGGGVLLNAGCVVQGVLAVSHYAALLYISKNGAGGSAARGTQTCAAVASGGILNMQVAYYDPAPVPTDYYTAQVTVQGPGTDFGINIKKGNSSFFSAIQLY